MRSPKRANRPRAVDYDDIAAEIQDVADFPTEYKVVLYGKAGTGKTTLASTFPKPMLFIDCNEKGTDSIKDVKRVHAVRPKTWEDIEALYWYLKANPDDLKSVAVDTVSQMQSMAIRHVLSEKRGDVTEIIVGGWGSMTKKDWGEAASLVNEWILRMRDLDLNMVFIAHDRVFTYNNEDEEDAPDPADRIEPSVGPSVMPSVARLMNGAVGVIGNCYIRETERVKIDPKTKKKRSVTVAEYCMRIGPHNYYVTKARKPRSIKMPPEIVDPDFSDIQELLGMTAE